MTERTPAEAVEAVAEFLETDKPMIPDNLDAMGGYEWAIFKVRTVALAFRLSAPQPRRRSRAKAE